MYHLKKSSFLSLLGLVMILLLATSCQKDLLNNQAEIEEGLPIVAAHLAPQKPYSGISYLRAPDATNLETQGILVFTDQLVFETNLKAIQHNEANWPTVEDPPAQNPDPVYIIEAPAMELFEETFTFYSLRKKLEEETKALLVSRSFTEGNDPDKFYIADPFLRTTLNPSLEIKIGSSIHKVLNSHIGVEILDGSVSTLNNIRVIDAGLLDDQLLTDQIKTSLENTGNVKVYSSEGGWIKTGKASSCFASFSSEGSGLVITVTDQSSGNYDMLEWDFGDGTGLQSGTAAQMGTLSHVYAGLGNYVICLRAYSSISQNCDDTKCHNWTAAFNCTSDFDWDVFNEPAKQIRFESTASASNGGSISIQNYEWDFGSGANPGTAIGSGVYIVSYAGPGLKTVTLKITDSFGCVDTKSEVIQVEDICCDATEKDKELYDYANSGNLRMKTKLWQSNLWFLSNLGASTSFQRKKWAPFNLFSYWGEEKASIIAVYLSGNAFEEDINGNDCAAPFTLSPAVDKKVKAWNNKARYTRYPGSRFWTRENSITSDHLLIFNGVSMTKTLMISDGC